MSAHRHTRLSSAPNPSPLPLSLRESDSPLAPSSVRASLSTPWVANSPRLKTLRVLPRAGTRARGWLIAGPLRIACALGPAGIVRDKREGDGATPAGRFRLLWGYYRPDRRRPPAGGVAAAADAARPGLVRRPGEPALQSPRPPARRRLHGSHAARRRSLRPGLRPRPQLHPPRARAAAARSSSISRAPGLTPTAGCVAISAADMRKLAPRLARGAEMWIG